MNRLVLVALLALYVNVALANYGPQACGSTGHNCIDGYATCEGGKCKCDLPKYVWGDGSFGCYRQNTVAAEVKNDPFLTTFNNETVPFPFPCRYLVTHVRQQLKDTNRDVIGHCEFKIYSQNAKYRGKFYSAGYSIAAKINYFDGRVVKFSASNSGTASAGNYNFVTKGTWGQWRPDGPWGNDDINWEDSDNGIKIKTFENDANKQLVFEFMKCGLRITYVPYDIVERRDQVAIPGLAIAINCAMHPVWLSNDKVMALAPWWQEGRLLKDVKLPSLNWEKSMLTRAFVNRYHQLSMYDTDGECMRTSMMLGLCDDDHRKIAFDRCYWMLKSPKFVRCADGQTILGLFNRCVDMVCGYMSCGMVQQAIKDAGCENVRGVPMLTSFMDGDLCYSMLP